MRSRFFLFLSIFLILIPINLHALDFNDLNSKHVIVYNNSDNSIVYSKDSSSKASIASLTKLMTLIVSIENIKDIDEEVTINSKYLNDVPWDASQLYITTNDKLTYKDLLFATLINSAADAAILLSHNVFDNQDNFILAMNDMAKKLQMQNTNFVNVIGYDDINQYSSAEDILKLLKYCLQNKTFTEIFNTRTYTMSNGVKLVHTIDQYNDNMNVNLNIIKGAKTGYTDNANYCLAYTFESSDKEFIVITLGANKRDKYYYHINDANIIINTIQKHYKNNYNYKGKVVKQIPIIFGKNKLYDIKMNNEPIFLPTNYSENLLKFSYDGIQEIGKNNIKKSKIGTIKIFYDNNFVKSTDVFIDENIKFSFIKELFSYKLTYIIIVLFLAFGIYKIGFNKKI